MPKLKNQLVACDKHGEDQLGYVVCKHVLDLDASVAYHLAPKPDELGEIFCEMCRDLLIAGENAALYDNVRLVCQPCALARVAGRLPS